ncbi:MAG: AmmeMemoRadiSam system radical SAM enzyme [Candidatus Thorarchaeota archaeon]
MFRLKDFEQEVVKKGRLQRVQNNGVRCMTCNHRCLLGEGAEGLCGTRVNVNGIINTVCYGNVSSLSNNPIEKKPLFHFAPGTRALTVGSWRCNATCSFCQNHHISKTSPSPSNSRYMSPQTFVDLAVAGGSEGTSISLNEAATLMLEWNIDVFREARNRGLYNTIVTNGYMTPTALDLMVDAGLDAANVDVKGCTEGVKRICGIDVEHVWANLSQMKEKGIHIEITTLVVPGLSDEEECLLEIAGRIVDELGQDVPWHVNRYHPHYQYREPETPLEVLLKGREIGWKQGLKYVYIGNVWQRGLEDTICPGCKKLVYQRSGFRSKNTGTDTDGRCVDCGHALGIRFWAA